MPLGQIKVPVGEATHEWDALVVRGQGRESNVSLFNDLGT
jgi:hypothetical protein